MRAKQLLVSIIAVTTVQGYSYVEEREEARNWLPQTPHLTRSIQHIQLASKPPVDNSKLFYLREDVTVRLVPVQSTVRPASPAKQTGPPKAVNPPKQPNLPQQSKPPTPSAPPKSASKPPSPPPKQSQPPPKGSPPSPKQPQPQPKGAGSPPSKGCRKTKRQTGGPSCPPQAPATQPVPPQKPPNGFKVTADGRHRFLDIDQYTVGVMLSNGNYESVRGENQPIKGTVTDPALKKIGTDTMTLCTSVYLIGTQGSIGVHLQPKACELFLKSSRKKLNPDRKKELKDELEAQDYKDLKAAMGALKQNCDRIVKDYQKRIGNFRAWIVMGPNQISAEWGQLMLKDLFGADKQETRLFSIPGPGITPQANDRDLVVDYSGSQPQLRIGQRTFQVL